MKKAGPSRTLRYADDAEYRTPIEDPRQSESRSHGRREDYKIRSLAEEPQWQAESRASRYNQPTGYVTKPILEDPRQAEPRIRYTHQPDYLEKPKPEDFRWEEPRIGKYSQETELYVTKPNAAEPRRYDRDYDQEVAEYMTKPLPPIVSNAQPTAQSWDMFRPPDHTPLAYDSPYARRRSVEEGTPAKLIKSRAAQKSPSRTYSARDVFMPPGHLTRSASSNNLLQTKSKAKPQNEEGEKRKLVDPHVVRDVYAFSRSLRVTRV